MSAFSFSRAPLDTARERAALADPSAGGYASFEGWVRDHNEGRQVTRLEYQAFEELAVKEGERIVAEAISRFGIRHARCVHRLGDLGIGEMAVWVGASSAHRAEAFAACRYIIDEVKHRVPIWKKEHYASGDSGWVNCERCAAPTGHDHDHDHGHVDSAAAGYDYSRQVALSDVGAAGQARLAAARVLVVGAGGLGCPVLMYLAGAGVGTLGIVDADTVEASNLHRQPLYAFADIGRPKAEAAAARITAMNPGIEVRVHAERLTGANAARLLDGYDAVVDCSDNFATKFLVNDAAVLASKPAVLASVYQYEGQLQVVRADRGGSCLRCLWPEATRDGLVGNCAESGVLGPVPGLFGSLQAIETLKLLLDLPGQLDNEIMVLDLGSLSQHRLRAPRCAECRDGACTRIRALDAGDPQDLEIGLTIIAAAAQGYRIVDIREPNEVAALPVRGVDCLEIPMTRLLSQPHSLAGGDRYLLVCARGQRSRAAAVELRRSGFRNVWSLRGGVSNPPV